MTNIESFKQSILSYCDNEYANKDDNAENVIDAMQEYIHRFGNWLLEKNDKPSGEFTISELLEIFNSTNQK